MQIVEHAPSLAPFHACALVPTMGALHAGHASLIRRAASDGRPVVVSLFVSKVNEIRIFYLKLRRVKQVL